ncbi:hypothetical protein STENM223S_01006 [Streptomyces tendae]
MLITGLATAAGLRRAGGVLVRWRGGGVRAGSGAAEESRAEEIRLAFLVAAALLALLAADLSGMSKAETERIWLPFALWILPSCAFLPAPRLAGGADGAGPPPQPPAGDGLVGGKKPERSARIRPRGARTSPAMTGR